MFPASTNKQPQVMGAQDPLIQINKMISTEWPGPA